VSQAAHSLFFARDAAWHPPCACTGSRGMAQTATQHPMTARTSRNNSVSRHRAESRTSSCLPSLSSTQCPFCVRRSTRLPSQGLVSVHPSARFKDQSAPDATRSRMARRSWPTLLRQCTRRLCTRFITTRLLRPLPRVPTTPAWVLPAAAATARPRPQQPQATSKPATSTY
jgi:hypothetical protein